MISVLRDNMVKRYRRFLASIEDGKDEDALDRVRPFHDRGTGFLVHKQECIEFARSMAHHDRAISVDDVVAISQLNLLTPKSQKKNQIERTLRNSNAQEDHPGPWLLLLTLEIMRCLK